MAFERFKSIFRRKKDEDIGLTDISEPIAPPVPRPSGMTMESATTDNMKAKMDLLVTQVEALNVRYETLNERLQNIERMVQEIYMIAKRR